MTIFSYNSSNYFFADAEDSGLSQTRNNRYYFLSSGN